MCYLLPLLDEPPELEREEPDEYELPEDREPEEYELLEPEDLEPDEYDEDEDDLLVDPEEELPTEEERLTGAVDCVPLFAGLELTLFVPVVVLLLLYDGLVVVLGLL